MILVWGEREDPPIGRVLDVLEERRVDFVHATAAALSSVRYDVTFRPTPDGTLTFGKRRVDVRDLRAMYLRPAGVADVSAIRTSAMLHTLAEVLPGVVLNRPSAGRSNHCKPLQAARIRGEGFAVPDTLVTTDPLAARAFVAKHGRVVYKSVSGVRSIVSALDASGIERLDGVANGPVQLQEWVEGLDVRVHVVGQRVFACAVRSRAADYRYAARTGDDVELERYDMDPVVARRVTGLARALGLPLAGVDLRRRPDGAWVCFEVNPSPGFTWYEAATSEPIAEAVVDLLQARQEGEVDLPGTGWSPTGRA